MNAVTEQASNWFEQAAKSGELAALLAPRKPNTPGKKRLGSYYQRHFAECLIPVLDAMLEDGKDRIFFYTQFPQYSKTSLRLRINQSWLYVVDHLDTPDRKYFRLRENIVIKMTQKGIHLIHRTRIIHEILMPEVVVEEEKTFSWREEFDKWLMEGAPNTKFEKGELALSDDEVNDLKITLHGLENIIANITKSRIKCIKLSDEDLAKLNPA